MIDSINCIEEKKLANKASLTSTEETSQPPMANSSSGHGDSASAIANGFIRGNECPHDFKLRLLKERAPRRSLNSALQLLVVAQLLPAKDNTCRCDTSAPLSNSVHKFVTLASVKPLSSNLRETGERARCDLPNRRISAGSSRAMSASERTHSLASMLVNSGNGLTSSALLISFHHLLTRPESLRYRGNAMEVRLVLCRSTSVMAFRMSSSAALLVPAGRTHRSKDSVWCL